MRRIRVLLIILLFFSTLQSVIGDSKRIIAVQHFSDFDKDLLDIVYSGIDSMYDVRVVFLTPVALPESAFYRPRNRYRAEIILDFLEERCPKHSSKILGLTGKDISTTKGEYYDWGIFGLGTLGGKSCIVSTYRLGKGKVSNKQFYERFIKVVNHEIGHTLGLFHCARKHCLMEDAKGSIKTVDHETGKFCPSCKQYLTKFLK